MIRFSVVAAATLGLATVSLGATAPSAADSARPAAPTAGALTLEPMASLTARPLPGARRAFSCSVPDAARLTEVQNIRAADLLTARFEQAVPATGSTGTFDPAITIQRPASVDWIAPAAPVAPAAADAYSVPSVADLIVRPVNADTVVAAVSHADFYPPAPARLDAHTASADYTVPAISQRSAGSVAPGFASISPAASVYPASAYSAPVSSTSIYPTSATNARPIAAATPVLSAVGQTAAAPAPIVISLASSDGNASTQTASFGITPSAGTLQFLLTTINPMGSVPAGYGSTPADTNVTNLNTYFGLAAGTLAGLGAADGSGYLSQQVTLTKGNIVNFDYVFLTDEDNTLSGSQYHNDRAFFTVNGTINSTIYQASSLSAAQLDNGSNTIFSFQTPGYVTVSYTVPASGNYVFGFGVIDVGVNTIKSGLLIDNFYYSPVPEPATWAGGVLLLGLSGVNAWRRRARRA